MKTYEQLINNIVGQLNGVNRMMENEENCFDTLAQLKAVKSALNSFTSKFLQENFLKCLERGDEPNEVVCKKFFSEILN